MDNERPDVHPPRYVASMRPSRGRETSRPALSRWHLRAVVLLGVLASVPALAQPTTPAPAAPRPLNPVLSGVGGSCGTQFAPCPALSRLGLFVWLSGQYLGTGLGGNPHASTLGGSVDIAMEVANRVAVSASLPGALSRIQGQYGEEIWVIGGPLEARARVRLGPASPGFYSVDARPRWSSVIEVRTQFLIPGLDGDAKYVGRVQRGFVQPAVYGAGELNVWRVQFAPGIGILVGDRQAHADVSLRVSVQLLDRLYGDVEVLRRQALGVPAEPGRCQSAWMGVVGARVQFRRGVFMNARYLGGQGDCVPQNAVQLNLGLAFGEGLLRIPTPEEVGFIKKWHALLMGMIDPVLDCQGILRADDGTPMFRFGYPDPRNPSIIRRNNVEYHVGEHFWEKDGNLYRESDLSHPVLDVHGESPLTFAERAVMHDCPTLPGLSSPCRGALDLPRLRHDIEHASSPMQVMLNEDAQLLACLAHLSPLKAAVVVASIRAALGPLIDKLPQVARWQNPATPEDRIPRARFATAAVVEAAPPPSPRLTQGGPPIATAPVHAANPDRGMGSVLLHKLGGNQKPDNAGASSSVLSHLPRLPEWWRGESAGASADNSLPAAPAARGDKHRATVETPAHPKQSAQTVPPSPAVVRSRPPPTSVPKAVSEKAAQQIRVPERNPSVSEPVVAAPVTAAPATAEAHGSHEPESVDPVCGTHCKLVIGAIASGAVAAGGELTKDVAVVGVAAGGGSLAVSAATAATAAAGGAITGKIITSGAADHAAPPSVPAEPTSSSAKEKKAPSDAPDRQFSSEAGKQLDSEQGHTNSDAADPRGNSPNTDAAGEEPEAATRASRTSQREEKEAERALKSNQHFRRWFHREYKADQVMRRGSRTNPDLTAEQVRDAYQEWLQAGMPKVK